MNDTLIPIAPINDYIDNMGGLVALPGTGIPVEVEIERPPYVRVKIDRTLDEQRRYNGARQALHRLRVEARQGGLVDLFAADAFICTHLKAHPVDVYADWFELGLEVEDGDEPVSVELRVVA